MASRVVATKGKALPAKRKLAVVPPRKRPRLVRAMIASVGVGGCGIVAELRVPDANHAASMQLAGHTWAEIVDSCGYLDKAAAVVAVRSVLTLAAEERAAEGEAVTKERLLLQLEYLRDQLLPRALLDKDNLKGLLDVMDRIVKLSGLEKQEAADTRPPMIIVSGTAEERVAILRRLVEDRKAISGRDIIDAEVVAG